MTKQPDRHLLEAALENSEAIVDAIVDNDLLKEIPVIGTAVRLCKARDAFRDRAFAAKLQKFILGFGKDDPAIANAWRSKMDSSPHETQKVGEVLYLVLEQLNDTDKATLLGKVFKAYLNDQLDAVDLRRLAQAIDMAFYDDLEMLVCGNYGGDDIYIRLIPSGLAGSETIVALDTPPIRYYITALGSKLSTACSSH